MKRALLTVFVLWLVLLGGNYALYLLVLPVRVLHHIVITAVLGVWIWRHGLPKTALNGPLLLAGVWVLISALLSIDPRMALENGWFWLNHSLLFLVLVDWIQRGRLLTLLRAHFVAGALLALVGLIEYALQPGTRVSSLLLLQDSTGAYAAPLLVLTIGWYLSACAEWPIRQQRFFALALIVALIGLLLVNNTRGALLSAVVGAAVLALLELKLSRCWLMAGAALVAAAVVGISAISLLPGRVSGDQHRVALWSAALYMTADYPLHGVGLGLFGSAFNTLYSTRPEQYALGAHNAILNTVAELGAPGLLVGALVVIVFLLHVPRQRTTIQNAALAALAGIAVHSLVDNFPDTSIVSLILLLAALLTPIESAEKFSPFLKYALVTSLLLCGLFLLRADEAQFAYERSLINGSVADAQRAIALDPTLTLYDLQLQRLAGDELPRVTRDFALVGYARYWR